MVQRAGNVPRSEVERVGSSLILNGIYCCHCFQLISMEPIWIHECMLSLDVIPLFLQGPNCWCKACLRSCPGWACEAGPRIQSWVVYCVCVRFLWFFCNNAINRGCPGPTCMMAFGSTMFRPVKVEPDPRNRPSPSCAAELRIVNLLDDCLSMLSKPFPVMAHPLDCTLVSSASARRIQGRRSQIWALVTLTRPWTERRFRSRPLHRPKQLRRWGFQKYTWPRGINKKSHITSLNLNWNCHHQNIATCCQYKDRFTKFMESVLQKSGKLRSQLRDLSEKFKSTAQVKSYLGRFFPAISSFHKNPEPHFRFPRYEQEVIDEIKTLDGEYDKLNEVLAHGAVDGYGKPFLAQ